MFNYQYSCDTFCRSNAFSFLLSIRQRNSLRIAALLRKGQFKNVNNDSQPLKRLAIIIAYLKARPYSLPRIRFTSFVTSAMVIWPSRFVSYFIKSLSAMIVQ